MHEDILVPLETAPSGMAFTSRKPGFAPLLDAESFPSERSPYVDYRGYQINLQHPDDCARPSAGNL